ncbi:MAG: PAS domain S-box protein, partial [Acidobacteria bacterium]|nr:PAS domain S-box protein [Acidobacteriota bacterium]
DGQERLWVGTYEHGLNLLDRGLGTFTRFRHEASDPHSLAADGVRVLFEDRDGTLWIGTDGGLHEWDRESGGFIRYQNDPANPFSLSHNTVLSLYQDAGGVLWVGTFGGLNKWNALNGNLLHFKDRGDGSQLANSYVTSFAEDRDGQIWVGTHGGGLSRFDRQRRTFRTFRHDPADTSSLSDDRVMALHVDSQGTLWVGTIAGGVNRLEGSGFSHLRHDPDDANSLSHDAITTIFEDREGAIWIGTYRGGLNRYDRRTGEFRRFSSDPSAADSLTSDRVLVVFEDRSGVLWIGTDGGGLNRFHPATGRFTAYRHHPEDPYSLSSDHIWTVNEDAQGNLWVGTQGGGLNRWSAKDRLEQRVRFSHFSKRQGLPSGIIYGALWDRNGLLWVSTNRGLSKLDPAEGTVVNYDSRHGLQSEEFNFGAAFEARDGQMFFGGINGFNTFDPTEMRGNQHVPPVVLTSFLKFNEVVDLGRPLSEVESIELSHKDHVIAFEYAALDYTAPEKNLYRHMLEGFDEGWVNAGTRRRATYTNLKPGSYVFRVKASNSDGVWNQDGIALRLEVAPAPWRTWWAYLLYAAGLGAVGFVFFRSQARKLQWAAELNHTNRALTQEIAERMAKEKALSEEKERAQAYFDVVEVIMVALDQDGTVSLINRKGCRVLGYKEEEIVGRNWFENFVPEGARAAARESVEQCEASEYAEYSLLTKKGEERIIAWHTSLLPAVEGSSREVITSGADVTQVRQLEQQLYTSQKMDAIGTLAGGIAHDFNNILQSILGYTIITLETIPLEDRAKDYLRRVVKAGERAKKLIGHILTFSQRRKQELQPIRAQIVIEEALELLRASLPTTIDIHQEIDQACPPIMADPTQIHQVVMNLGTNAFQAMEGGTGVLTVTLNKVEIDGRRRRGEPKLAPGEYALLTVEDEGVGMDRATLDRIFDPFFSTRKVGSGTGLGLSVVHGIVEGVRGQILVSSQPGKGTKFEIYIPCCKRESVAESSEEEPPETGRERILIVDDEEDIVRMGTVMLENMGYAVVGHTSSLAALQEFQARPRRFDLVITDQTMPGLTGSRLAEEVKRIRPEVPVVLISGFLGAESAEGPVDRFIQKPFVSFELGKLVRELLDRRPSPVQERAS